MNNEVSRLNKRLDILMKELSSLKATHRDLKKKFDLYRKRSFWARLTGKRR